MACEVESVIAVMKFEYTLRDRYMHQLNHSTSSASRGIHFIPPSGKKTNNFLLGSNHISEVSIELVFIKYNTKQERDGSKILFGQL